MSSRQADTLTKAEFLTTTHRLTGEVQTGTKPLSDLLNDRSQSYLLVFNVYLSRLDNPSEIGPYAPVAYLAKDNISCVVVPQHEARLPKQGRYSAQNYEALVTLPGFEIVGKFAGPPRFDLRTFSLATLGAFIVLSEASAQVVSVPKVTFTGEVILVNRAHLESFCLIK